MKPLRPFIYRFISILIIVIFSSLHAQNTSTLTGTVSDASTGDKLPGVNVSIVNTTFGAATDIDGKYMISKLEAGFYSVRFSFVGYNEVQVDSMEILPDSTITLNIGLEEAALVGEEIIITATRPVVEKNMTSSVALRGGRSADIEYYLQSDHNTEEYGHFEENDFRRVMEAPLSTFAADVDGASYANARRFIMRDQLPYPDAVRVEEFVNYFNYDYPNPEDGHPLSINLEWSQCPWNADNQLLHIGLQAKKLAREDQQPSNLTFLIDVSGSMSDPEKLPLLKKAFKMLVHNLKPADKVSIVVYAGAAGCILPPTAGSDKEKIVAALENLEAGGSTAGGEGVRLAYKLAAENFQKNGNNRVVLATDGDFNVGISSTSELVRFIEKQRDSGIFLTVLGFGMGNYKDYRLQELADRGNGNHAYIDNILEAKKVLVQEIAATLYTVAKDVKIQLEFNPAIVESYRLIGYVNRKLEAEDFQNDRKDAGEVGPGHSVTALYEIVPVRQPIAKSGQQLKYLSVKLTPEALQSGESMILRVRYKPPQGNKSLAIEKAYSGSLTPLRETSDNFRFSAAVAAFAMLLRDSKYLNKYSLNDIREMAEGATGADSFGYRSEFLNLLQRVELLREKPLN